MTCYKQNEDQPETCPGNCKVHGDFKSVEELLPIMGPAYKDLSVQVAYKEGYNAAVKNYNLKK